MYIGQDSDSEKFHEHSVHSFSYPCKQFLTEWEVMNARTKQQ